MTIEEYGIYSNIATKLFDYMNGRINTMNNKCVLYIDMYDFVKCTYANIRYPNFIFIHIGTIIDSWNDEWSVYIDKKDYITSCIAWALSHELHHADQLISMITYNNNIAYKQRIEADVERASYDWVNNHKKELSYITGFNIVIDKLTSPSLPDNAAYTKANPREFYLQTIANIVIRDLDLFYGLKVFTNDDICEDMILVFNKIDTIVIKSNGRFLEENIPLFSSLVYKWTGEYDTYHIYADISFSYVNDKRKTAIVNFTISDRLIDPMRFKD